MKTTTLASRRSIESAVPESAWSRERSPTRRNRSRSGEMVGRPRWRARCPSPIGQLSFLTPTERAHYPWHHHDRRHETPRSCETCSPGRRYGSAFELLSELSALRQAPRISLSLSARPTLSNLVLRHSVGTSGCFLASGSDFATVHGKAEVSIPSPNANAHPT